MASRSINLQPMPIGLSPAEVGISREQIGTAPRVRENATYTLCYEDDCRGLEKRVRFEAENAAVALEIARGEAGGRWAILMCEGEILCRLEREAVGSSEYWVVAPVQKTAN
ncbi:hypothetical protein [Sphingopyxis sp. OAS728]|uniref:hypothetical protein n=1 Tax=Sphingopyxis sp. OAS728 TaxID=2663823 RepID=UPI00178BD523|nr:hypothetical protein [Sphingopyxis sp. OAS728]